MRAYRGGIPNNIGTKGPCRDYIASRFAYLDNIIPHPGFAAFLTTLSFLDFCKKIFSEKFSPVI